MTTSTPANTTAAAPEAAPEIAKTSNFLRQIIENDLE